jgi:hypothetical protein
MGPLIPYMLLSYDIGTSFISIMYEKPFPLDSYFPPVVVRIPDSQCTTMSGKFRSECPMIKEHSCYQSSSLPESSLNCGTWNTGTVLLLPTAPGVSASLAYILENSYAASFVGWLLAAAMNSHMLQYLDTGAILAIGAALQLTSNLLRFWSPPFGLFATTFFISSLGVAFQDSHSNTFVSIVNDAHRWLGFIHAMYALGALVSPFVATPIAASMQPKRSIFYVFLVGLGVANMVGVLVAFRDSIRSLSRSLSTSEDGHAPGRGVEAFRGMANTLRLRVVWILSIYFFFMLGIGITAGGMSGAI